MRNRVLKTAMAFAALWVGTAVFADALPKGFTDDFAAASTAAEKSGKNLYVVFTGSDWCVYCKRFHAAYLAKDEFASVFAKSFELVYLDFPQKKSLVTDAVRKQNEALQRKYGVDGYPTVMVMNPQGEVLVEKARPKGKESVADYFARLEHVIATASLVERHLKPFEEALASFSKKVSPAELLNHSQTMPDVEELKSIFVKMQGLVRENLGELKALAEKAEKTEFPPEIAAEAKEMKDGIAFALRRLEEVVKLTPADIERLWAPASDDKDDKPSPVSRRIVIPTPDRAKVDTDYIRDVALPFYTKHIVDTYVPAEGTDAKAAEEIRACRRALALYLATGVKELPSGGDFALAHALFVHGCRDAAVCILQSRAFRSDEMYWNGLKLFKEACAVHDFAREPVLGFLLRQYAIRAAENRVSYDKKKAEPELKRTQKESAQAFAAAAEIYRAADPRVLERFGEIVTLPEGVYKDYGDEYLACCQRGLKCLELAFDSRGSGWASDVTEEGWKGWSDYNKAAETNLLRAVELRPDEAFPAMYLASLYGRGCGKGDAFEWCNRAISNSLDRSAQTIDRFLHFETSRWGGSTRELFDIACAAATNVDVRSLFSYRTAATALEKIFIAEADGDNRSEVVKKVLNAEIVPLLFGMLDKYIAAPESPYMPSRDTFAAMGMSLAIQTEEWDKVRYYRGLIGDAKLFHFDAWWLKMCAYEDNQCYYMQMFNILTASSLGDGFLEAEESLTKGDFNRAFELYTRLSGKCGDFKDANYLVGRRLFQSRVRTQDEAGGWVDVMPTENCGEAVYWWGFLKSFPDGRARLANDNKGYYRVDSMLPGLGVEYEATVHFEHDDPDRKTWNIGWGLARPFSGFCADNSSWAFPYIAFWRDEKGDHVSVESFTAENIEEESKAKFKDISDKLSEVGRAPEFEVYAGDLESKDDHSFSLSTRDGSLLVVVDGKEVYRAAIDDMMELEQYSDRIQRDGMVYPVWKVFKGATFSGYRYRKVGGADKGE